MEQSYISVIHSIPDGAALINTVLCHYPISMPLGCKLYKRGLDDTYLVETEDKNYILRIYRRSWRNKQEIDFELEVLAFLHAQSQAKPTLFDFDQCGYGWRAFDIAKFLHASLRMNINITVRNKFVEGYQTIRQLSQDELESIPIFMKAAHIWLMGISANAGEEILPYGWFTDEWLDSRLTMLRSLDMMRTT
ncbi:phosphotransferase [Nostoc sp. TCL26-01]|uniref:phosphotransferase n=1 Tax=Nostoc sp. TCL26-01 TaxID=2576904 RepID=UPI0015BB83E1|nr:phosphotransferase [Nostoc sp. TCL26-01]QLE57382.1 hypothetical protein FD725_18765 [Nostoc sp. TCL26-01]